MKTKLTIIAILITITCAQAQNEKFKHFEIDVSANFWTPSSTHMKATNSITQISIDNNYISYGGISGYGNSIEPTINLTYYFKNNLGISLGYNPLIMDNKLSIIETDSTFSNYENKGTIDNITLGLVGRIQTSSAFYLFYGLGINFVTNYDLRMKVSTESESESYRVEAIDLALGFYLISGIKIKLYKFISLRTDIEYSFIPSELKYTNSEGLKIKEKTNLGGLGLQTGLSFNF